VAVMIKDLRGLQIHKIRNLTDYDYYNRQIKVIEDKPKRSSQDIKLMNWLKLLCKDWEQFASKIFIN
jgi:hypothetical protein